jgi:Right handed beta helix region
MTARRATIAALAAAGFCGIAACSGASSPAAGGPVTPRSHPTTSRTPTATNAGSGAATSARSGVPAACSDATDTVSTAAELTAALASAQPGTKILLAPGVYDGDFVAAASGSASAPIWLCGSRNAVLQGQSITSGYTLYLDKASYWRVEGFTVAGGQKGVVTDGASYDVIDGLYVHGTGDEAIHLRSFSSHDVVSNNLVRDTGLDVQFYGEGIYIGSAHSNWCRYTGCQPDRSDDNTIAGNNIAATTAENIDVKEGTTGGTITGNTLNGTGMVASAATAWINVKGNDWRILDNTGVDTIGDGYQVHQVYSGWGIGNVFLGNSAIVSGVGVGIYVQSKDLQTIIGCNNAVSGGQLSNQACQNT